MSQVISEKINPNRISREPFGLKAESSLNRITLNPSSASPGETLYINIPKLAESVVIVPNSVALLFNIALTGGSDKHANNRFVNNLAACMKSRYKINFGGETIQDTNRYDLYKLYSDLHLTKKERENKIREGISGVNMHKLRAGAGDKVSSDAKEVALAAVYNTKYRLPLDHPILDNHGVFYPKSLDQSLIFEITLPESKDLVITSDNTKPHTYAISNLELEYQSISSDYLANEAKSAYQIGKGFYYEYLTLHKTFTINKATDSILNQNINIPRRSMTGILMLFTEAYVAGARDSEKFVNPSITSIKVNVDGVPNRLYSKGMDATDFYHSVTKRFGVSDNIAIKDYYSDKFALWIDLRTYHDNSIHGNGLHISNTRDGVHLEMKRKVGGSGTITCFMFVVADALMEVMNSNLRSIMY